MVEAATKTVPSGMRRNRGSGERKKGHRLRVRNEAKIQKGMQSKVHRKVLHEEMDSC